MNMPARRLLAFGLDYLVIALYLGLLFAASFAVMASQVRAEYLSLWSSAGSAELGGFILLTLPVVLYFALLESSVTGATIGKRLLHVKVLLVDGQRLSLGRALLRSVVKFLPWELAHFTIWQVVFSATNRASPPAWTTVTITVVYLLVAAYLVSLLIGRTHRTIYDRIAGATVVVAP